MPNYVRNQVRITADSTAIDSIIKALTVEKDGYLEVDFNKFIPMPKELDMECGSESNAAYELYGRFMVEYMTKNLIYDEDLDVYDIPESEEVKYLNKVKKLDEYLNDPEKLKTRWELGKQQAINRQNYGAKTWYDWRIDNRAPNGMP